MTDDTDLTCDDGEFCMFMSHPHDCSYTVEGRHTHTKQNKSNSVRFVKTSGYKRCEIMACGYLRKHLINPRDISTIIGKYLRENNKVELKISNDHMYRMFLFPSMKQVCINFCKIFNFTENGCNFGNCNRMCLHCGIIGIPQMTCNISIDNSCSENKNKSKSNDKVGMTTFFNLLNVCCAQNDSGLDFSFEKMKDSLESTLKRMRAEKDNVNTTNINNCNKQIGDIEIIDCPMMRTSGTNKMAYRINYSPHGIPKSRIHVTQLSMKPVSNNIFAFNNDDFVLLKYDKKDNSLKIEAHCNDDTDNVKDYNPLVLTRTDDSCLSTDVPITAHDDKIFLKNGYDYVLACCLRGCDKRTSGMNNVYAFSGK